MARYHDHSRALELRKQGKSYSEIKELLKVGKGTLSAWLREYPLAQEDLVRLRDKSPRRIESFRNTMQKKRDNRLLLVRERIAADISQQDSAYFLAGLFLYWAEGGKTKPYTLMMANTDPAVLQFFLSWLELLGWDKSKVRVRIQLYADSNIELEQAYWMKILKLPGACFYRPYIKKTNRKDMTYKGYFGHGTCNVIVNNRDISEYVLQGIDVLREKFKHPVRLPVSPHPVGYGGMRA